MERRRTEQEDSFVQQLAEQAQRLQEEVKTLVPGTARNNLMRRARQTKIASEINEWLNSLGLTSPT